MQVKGRITKAGPLVTRQKKDGTGDYQLFEVTVQIGLFTRIQPDYQTQSFTRVQVPDEIKKDYLHQNAINAEITFHKGEVVLVDFHHYINKFGRTETVVDEIRRLNDTNNQEQGSAPAQEDKLPF